MSDTIVTRLASSSKYSIVILSLLATACGGGGGDNGGSNGPPSVEKAINISELEVGLCVSPEDDNLYVSEMWLPECGEEHLMEVAGLYQLEETVNSNYPSALGLKQRAYEDCQPYFERYVGIPFWDSVYDIETITPSASTWGQGDREVVCLVVYAEGETLTTSVRDAQI